MITVKKPVALLALTAAGVGVFALSGCDPKASGSTKTGGDTKTSKTSTDQLSDKTAEKDVTIGKCTVDPTTHWASADLRVKNPKSKNSTFIVTVAFDSVDGKTQYDTGLATVDSLAPGQTTTEAAQGLKTVHATKLVCRVTDVQRMAS